MAKNNDVGLFQWGDKKQYWGYRITITKDGKKKDTTSKKNSQGLPYATKNEAKKAREQRVIEMRSPTPTTTIKDIQFKEIWEYYESEYSKRKAYATLKKYKSLWENHIKNKFANKFVSEITISDIEVFLQELYNYGYAYGYVESFYKCFYQLYGLLYSRDNIDIVKYNKMWIDKNSKVKMPQISQDDKEKQDDLITYNSWEIEQLNNMFVDTNLYFAFMCGYYLGLRVSETFALMWNDYNWETHKITINKQLNVEDGIFCLRRVKTLNSVREIDVPLVVHNYLMQLIREQKRHPTQKFLNNKCEIVVDKISNPYKNIVGGDFINRSKDGKLLTINSLKYYSKKAKNELGINFKYHSLRKTHLTQLASMGCPLQELKERAGHKKIETTMKYYIDTTSTTHQILLNCIGKLDTKEKEFEIIENGEKKLIKESTLIKRQKISAILPH